MGTPVGRLQGPAGPAGGSPASGSPGQTSKGPGGFFRPEGMASHYNAVTTPDSRPDPAVVRRAAQIVEAVSDSLGIAAPGRDARLNLVASDLTRLPSTVPADEDLVAKLSWVHGLIEPAPVVFQVSSNDPSGKLALDTLRGRLPGLLATGRFGRVGIWARRTAGLWRLVVVLQETHIATHPIARSISCSRSLFLTGRVIGPFVGPSVVVTRPDGSTAERRGRGRGKTFSQTLRFNGGQGSYQVEILARGSAGPTVLANFPVYCGVRPPTVFALAPRRRAKVGRAMNVSQMDARLVSLVNRDRSAARRSMLRRWSLLDRVARSHSIEMCRTGRFGHYSPVTGSASDRLRRVGLRPSLVAENVAQAADVDAAHRALMGSPSHRANILAGNVTLIGVGVVPCRLADGTVQVDVTELFIRK
ncbi:MAG: hypothetical protein J7M25_16055 [Deltaproteobacteria bacterium]|nr:hypothetical protein [Deltaproteobacteria bacterium]